jgi:hypothetical protein
LQDPLGNEVWIGFFTFWHPADASSGSLLSLSLSASFAATPAGNGSNASMIFVISWHTSTEEIRLGVAAFRSFRLFGVKMLSIRELATKKTVCPPKGAFPSLKSCPFESDLQ